MATERPATERAVLLIAIAVALSGFVGSVWVATSTSTADRPQIDGNVTDGYQSIRGVDATRTTTIERNGTVTSNRTYSVRMRPATGAKRLSLVGGTESKWDRQVSNGSVLWLYDRSAGNATRIRLTGPGDAASRGERIAALFARLDAAGGDAASDEPPTVEPLPVVPQASAGQPGAVRAAGGSSLGVSYAGTDSVAGREVHVLRLTPVNEAGATNYEQTLWLDAERFFPLKQRTAWTRDGERTVMTTTYADVRFDPGLDDGIFVPDFPANTTVRSPETPETTAYRDAEALTDATDVAVPDPRVHPTYELAYATRTTGQVHGVGLRYVNRTSAISVAKYNFTYPFDGDGERVTIDGRAGQLTRGRTVTLSWNCGDYRYTVQGTGTSADAVVAVGESVGCPGA